MVLARAAAAQMFGKYALVAKLATGGMAEIFLARLQGAAGFEKLVCIKRILPYLAKDQQLVSMFLAEARIAAQISHPNVCQVFELGEIDTRYFIAMEYLEGVPFACFRRRDMYPAQPDARLVAGLGVQACEGLHHAHNLKRPDGTPYEVVHRDVSTNNLFCTVDGIVKVLDFGIAKIQDASVRTSTGSVKGTYAYMAPEQLRGEQLDRRTDVFAMGIVLWELFARKHLFKRDTEFLTFQAITTDPIPEVCDFRNDVPIALSRVVAKALSRDRDERYPTARALGEALAHSVSTMGGPMSASELSEHIERSFAARLEDQRVLIRIAREGGALELDEDLGPAVGHGTEMIETPVSMISGRVRTRPGSTPVPNRSRTLPAYPARRGSRVWTVLLVMLALGAAGAAVFFWLEMRKTRGEPSTLAAAPVLIDAGAPVTRPPDAAVAVATPADAAVAHTIDAGVVPPDAAVVAVEPPRDERRRRKTPPDKVVPKGPPGFITIDSSPVYAVIYIDGKRYGETPLVRIQLAPGKHRVKAVSPSGTTRTMTITIQPGKVAPTRRIEW